MSSQNFERQAKPVFRCRYDSFEIEVFPHEHAPNDFSFWAYVSQRRRLMFGIGRTDLTFRSFAIAAAAGAQIAAEEIDFQKGFDLTNGRLGGFDV